MRRLGHSTFAAGRSKRVPLDNKTCELIQTLSVSLGLTSAYNQGVPVDLHSKVVLNDMIPSLLPTTVPVARIRRETIIQLQIEIRTKKRR